MARRRLLTGNSTPPGIVTRVAFAVLRTLMTEEIATR
jgi:hypothetical protein